MKKWAREKILKGKKKGERNFTLATPSSPAEATHQGTYGWKAMSVINPIECASSFFHTFLFIKNLN